MRDTNSHRLLQLGIGIVFILVALAGFIGVFPMEGIVYTVIFPSVLLISGSIIVYLARERRNRHN